MFHAILTFRKLQAKNEISTFRLVSYRFATTALNIIHVFAHVRFKLVALAALVAAEAALERFLFKMRIYVRFEVIFTLTLIITLGALVNVIFQMNVHVSVQMFPICRLKVALGTFKRFYT